MPSVYAGEGPWWQPSHSFILLIPSPYSAISYCNSLSDSSAAGEEKREEKHPRVEEWGWAKCPPEAEWVTTHRRTNSSQCGTGTACTLALSITTNLVHRKIRLLYLWALMLLSPGFLLVVLLLRKKGHKHKIQISYLMSSVNAIDYFF